MPLKELVVQTSLEKDIYPHCVVYFVQHGGSLEGPSRFFGVAALLTPGCLLRQLECRQLSFERCLLTLQHLHQPATMRGE